MLFALQPDAQGTFDLAKNHKMDALSVAYLRVLLRSRPDDNAIRYTLARELSAIGEHVEARGLIVPLTMNKGKAALEAHLLLLEIDRARMKRLAPADPQRSEVAARIATHIDAMLDQPLSNAALATLAQASRELSRPDLAARALERLARTDPTKRPQWLAQAASEWLSGGAPLKAALAYQSIATTGNLSLADKRQYTLLALNAFTAANNGKAALRFADWAARNLGADLAVMEQLVAVAQAANQPAHAQRFGRQRLALTPDSPQALERQLDLELAVSALPKALSLATRLVALAPTVERRTRLAHIAEWNARQEAALTQWAALARLDSTGPAMARALALALARDQNDLWLELVGLASSKRALTSTEHTALLAIAQRQPDAPHLIGALEAGLARDPAPLDLWIALSDAQAGAGDLTAALATLQRMPPALAGPVETARLQALVLARAGHPDQALERLRAVRTQAAQSDTSYWMLLGDLAWPSANRDDASRAYRMAWANAGVSARAADRLIEAASAEENYTDAIAVARAAHRRFDDPRWLLMAMDLASRAQRWDELRELLATAHRTPGQLAHAEMYWIQSANLARHDGRQADARAAHERALLLNRDSVSARVALLWFEIDNGDRSRLGSLLREWRDAAQGDAAYWAPFAAGMLRLQRAGEALPWFERQLRIRPDDIAWTLQYAEALAQAGRTDDAVRERRAAYLRLRAQFDGRAPSGNALSQTLLLPYARLVREFDGEAAAQAFLARLIERGDAPGPARELLVASLLAEQNFGAARSWLQRSRTEQFTLPAWQHLAVAQADNHLPDIAAIVASSAAQLSALDHIAALRKLGRNAQALAVAESASLAPDNAGNALLRDTTAQLRKQQSKGGGLVAEQRQLGGMAIRRFDVHASAPLAAGRASVRLVHTTVGDSAAAQLPAAGKEDDLSAAAQLPFGTGEASITLGANRRHDDSMPYARAEWTHPLAPGLQLRLDGAINAVSEESALLRVIGSKDRLGGALTADLGNSRYARLDLASQRYATRRGERLGSGYRIEGEMGALLFRQGPSLQARVSGSWEQNRLAARLPAALGGVTLPDSASVADAIPARFGWAGAGATLAFGDQSAMPRRMYGSIDALVGKQWPDRSAAHSVRAMLGVPLATGGVLRTEAFHSNVQGGVGAAGNRGIRLSYEHTF